ncbi:LysR family transcriptional regulator [Nocardia sp. ET3-3]|uniref:LysR family transcriptional regulator n=1 Tax=Nocardia terrae TaxID=2675851 RepID=A0A7K1V5L0_9NOCA|nr:LysR family transcriptional regulator [Nocardia terrae]MVU81772.1 LysR family transcriptional regulator [Nocardia terrae]
MELRDIEIFLVLAEELHFSRTAERLHVSPARISQAIKKQERMIGADLFERTSRSVRLTEVGRELQKNLHPAYRDLHESIAKARLSVQGKTSVLRIGTMNANGYELRAFWEEFRKRHPRWGLQLRHAEFIHPFATLRSGAIDGLIAWLPIEEPDLTVGPVLFTEGRDLLVPVEHPLAQESTATFEALSGTPVATSGTFVPEYWENEMTPFYTPRGHRLDKVVTVTTSEQVLSEIAHGVMIHAMPMHRRHFMSRPDLASVPITDLPLLRWALIWRSDAEDDRIRALAAVIRDLGPAAL